MPTKKKNIEDTNIPVVECVCGAKILVVPNVKQMSKAIDDHAEVHVKKMETSSKKEKDTEREKVRDDLTAKVLQKAGEA